MNKMWSMVSARRTLVAFLLLAVTKSPSAAPSFFITDGSSSPVALSHSRVSVLEGGEARLPCDTRPGARADAVQLVVWYRGADPVYSFDARVTGPTAHWVEDAFAGRALWQPAPVPALRLRDVRARDRADYSCRVDFHKSPTRHYGISLDVVELPSKPIVFDEYGKEIIGTAGPYHEGREFKLICTVNGGYPIPKVQWLQGDTVLATLKAPGYHFDEDYEPLRTLTLVIKNATRAHLAIIYTCLTNNTSLAPPRKTAVQIDLYLKPLTVEIVTKEQPLSVGMKSELLCKTKGARPPAVISWWLGRKKLDAITNDSSSQETNSSESLMQWVPLKEYNGQVLICRVEHTKFNHSSIEARLPLNVYYMPEVIIHLGAKINPDDIEEGDDVYFGCKVDANPPAYKVIWEHNGAILQHNPSQGVIVTGNTHLALRNISRHAAGYYACVASNVEGDGRAPDMLMRVVYKPLCTKKEMEIIGVALHESVTVTCAVDAFPPPDTFEWTLNNSAGSHVIEADRYTVEAKEGISRYHLEPSSETEYGTLWCRAGNLAGRQAAPCAYAVRPATAPDPPRDCTVHNLTEDAYDVFCLPGYEGGLRCSYGVEVWAGEELLRNASNDSPSWSFRRLRPSQAQPQLKFMIYATNRRGRSRHVMLTVEPKLKLSSRTKPHDTWEPGWEMGIFLGILLTVVIMVCFVTVALKSRRQNRDYEVSLPTLKSQKVMMQKGNSLQSLDDKNPDLIPLNKGAGAVGAAVATLEPPRYSGAAGAARSSLGAHSLPRARTPNTPITTQAYHTEFQNEFGRAAARAHHEIVTTRTPLLSGQQESRV